MGRLIKKVVSVVLSVCLMVACFPSGVSHAYSSNNTIKYIVNGMTVREKITQCMMIDFRKWNNGSGAAVGMTELNSEVADLLAEYKFGAVILFAENIKETKATVRLTNAMQAATMSKGGLPLLIATDQEGGVVYRLGSGTALPGNMALAATGDSANAKIAGGIIGRELDSVGINTTLSPVVDVNNNASNPVIGLRSFSDDPSIVGEFGSKYIEGLNEYNIIGCAKHFPGHGDTATDSHYGLPMVDKSEEELFSNELKPYTIAIDQGIDMIMTAHILYPQLDDTTIHSDLTGNDEQRPATLSYKILTELLRGKMNFNGVVVTDAMNMEGVAKTFSREQSTIEAIKAGADIVCMPVTGVTEKSVWVNQMNSIIDSVEQAVDEGELSMDRLNEAVTRILILKEKKGILNFEASHYTEAKAVSTVGSSENRKLEREISAKAVTVIKNENDTLPIKTTKESKILMLAPYENERAQMVMGFNRAKEAKIVPSEAKVKVYAYSDEDYKVEGEIKKLIDWADTVIINSEISNINGMTYNIWSSIGPKNFTEYCKSQNKKSIIMSVNKPYDVQLYPASDALIAVYGFKGSTVDVTTQLLDGDITDDTAAFGPNIVAGIEVMFGVFGASGKLPVNIPVVDIESAVYKDEIAYKRGYGLTYDKLGEWKDETTKESEKKTEQSTTEAKKTEGTTAAKENMSSTQAGTVIKLKKGTYKVLKDASGNKSGTIAYVKAANNKNIVVPDNVVIDGKRFAVTQISTNAFKGKKISSVTIGKNVKKIASGAFSGSGVKTVTIKTKQLTAASVKGSLKGSKVNALNIKLGNKSLNKKYIKKYKKIFTLKNSGKEVKVR